MSGGQEREGSDCRDVAVLCIVPAVVAALTLVSWALAHWKIGPVGHGPVIGARAGLAYKEDRVQLYAEDTLFMYTDGVTEAHDKANQLFGDQRLAQMMAAKKNEDVKKIVLDVVAEVKAFEGDCDQYDDVTAMAVKYQKKPIDTLKKLKVEIINDLAQIDKVNQAFNSFSEENHISTSVRRKLNLVFDELLNNIISYAYDDDKEHHIGVEVELTRKKLTISITDDGLPFNPFAGKTPDITIGLEDRKIGGYNYYI